MSSGTFAGVAGALAMASVDGTTINGIQAPNNLPPSSEHLAWGFYFGGLPTDSAGASGYVGLGFWVAGPSVPAGILTGLTGTSTYTGGMIGTTVGTSGNTIVGVATQTGQFSQAWNFGTRTATMAATYGGVTWTNLGLSYNPNAGSPYNGITYSGSGSAPQALLAVQGSFFHNPATGGPVGSSNLPLATGGQFSILGTNWAANGIFVGHR
jgi:hypothetical protein